MSLMNKIELGGEQGACSYPPEYLLLCHFYVWQELLTEIRMNFELKKYIFHWARFDYR